jgi:hypothetical protein
MWRLYSDITDEYSSGVGNPMGFADIARYWALKQDELAPWNGPGHWNGKLLRPYSIHWEFRPSVF